MKTTLNITPLHNLIKEYGFIAGGSCRSLIEKEEPKDYDIFCYTKEGYEPIKTILLNMYGKTRENALVFQMNNIQLIKPRENKYLKTYGTPFEVVSKFDFSVCRGYFDGKEAQFIDSDSLAHIEAKSLVINNIVCPISTTKRIIKYTKRGYFIKIREILKLYYEFSQRVASGDINIDSFNLIEDMADDELYELLAKYNID